MKARLERGQVLVIVALLMTAFVGMLALTLDVGLLVTQRRFDQNAADAAALAASRMLAESLSPMGTSGPLYFTWPDADVYREVRRYAGLDPATSSGVPTGVNRAAGIASRTVLAVTLEYWNGASNSAWCYSPSGEAPPRAPAVPRCTGTTVGGIVHPPLPAADRPYHVRVTVSSTTNALFAGVIGRNALTPPTAQDGETPACLRPAAAVGNTSCAHAVATVAGSTAAVAPSPVIPMTTGDCQIAGPSTAFLELWGANPSGCGADLGSWKNYLDFSTEAVWCSGGNQNPDYNYIKLMPPGAHVPGSACQYETPDLTWTRTGFQPDPRWPGHNDPQLDLAYWIAAGFGGAVRASVADGNRMPTYQELPQAGGGNLGQNVAQGFYCGAGVTATSCPTSVNPAGTYFFAKNQPGYHDVCPDPWGQRTGAGCRDTTVATWIQPEWMNQAGTAWLSSAQGGPARVRLARLLTFRLYCDHNAAGLCTQPPSSVVGSASNSSVWGRTVSSLITGSCATCTTGPSLNGNKAALS